MTFWEPDTVAARRSLSKRRPRRPTPPSAAPPMPELPEVEVVRRGIDAWATNRTISRVDVLHARSIRRCEGARRNCAPRSKEIPFRCASRRGKYLWLPLARSSDQALVVHLGMSGQVLMQPPSEDDETHLRVRVASPTMIARCASSTSGPSVGCTSTR